MIITNYDRSKTSHLREFLELNILGDGAYLSGGSAMSIVDDTHIYDDYDVFFHFNSSGEDRDIIGSNVQIPAALTRAAKKLLNEGFELVYMCPKHTLFSYKRGDMKIQLIVTVYRSIEDTLHAFDLVQCRVAFDGVSIFTERQTLRCIFRKQIKVAKSVHNPIRTISRIMKYHKDKNYNVEVFEILKLCSHNKYKMDIDSTVLDLGFYL